MLFSKCYNKLITNQYMIGRSDMSTTHLIEGNIIVSDSICYLITVHRNISHDLSMINLSNSCFIACNNSPKYKKYVRYLNIREVANAPDDNRPKGIKYSSKFDS